MPNVTLKQLRAFVMLARQRSFTKAAACLNISQSALTIQIRDLETEVGIRLFNRSTRSVDMTPQGAKLFNVIEEIIDQLDHALDHVKSSANLDKGVVTVAAGGSIIRSIIAPAIANLRQTHPGLSVRVIEDSGLTASARLSEGQADFAIAPVKDNHNVKSHPLLRDRTGILCREDNPLARQQQDLQWSDLRGNQLIMLRSGKTIRNLIDAHRDISKYMTQPKYEVSSISALVSLVEQGVGVSVISSLAAYPALRTGLVFRPIHNPPLFRELHVIHLRRYNLTSAALELVSAIYDVLSDLSSIVQLKGVLEVANACEWVRSARGRTQVRKIAQPHS